MPNVITYEPSSTIKQPSDYFFPDDFQNLQLLKELPPLTPPTTSPLLLYPGCGIDILFPLYYLEYLFPTTTQINLLFIDIYNFFLTIQTILNNLGITITNNKFQWKHLNITFEFKESNIFHILSTLPQYDIYFERTFRIMKSYHPDYETTIYNKLKPQGIIISDSGFQHLPLKQIPVPKRLSSYGEMIIGVKKS